MRERVCHCDGELTLDSNTLGTKIIAISPARAVTAKETSWTGTRFTRAIGVCKWERADESDSSSHLNFELGQRVVPNGLPKCPDNF